MSPVDGVTGPTVMEEDPLEEVLDIANYTEEQGQLKFAGIL